MLICDQYNVYHLSKPISRVHRDWSETKEISSEQLFRVGMGTETWYLIGLGAKL